MFGVFNRREISPDILQSIGYVAVVAGSIEHYVEDIILNITRENVAGVRPSTDLVSISRLIDRLDKLATDFSSEPLGKAVKVWCEAAQQGFICRNAILHGMSIVYNGDSLDFITNTGYRQELRKLESRSFVADSNTTRLLAQAFAVLKDAVFGFMLFFGGKITEEDVFRMASISALKGARSTTRESANLADFVNNEKY
jgi:hypothetical protein